MNPAVCWMSDNGFAALPSRAQAGMTSGRLWDSSKQAYFRLRAPTFA
ncbi:MAG: hypothetical protein V3S33_00485 [Gammaproteobacteria bacterium]